ncbi:hypothetical protein MSIMFI_00817 [Mycobacterium simulans]|nr:hypothetical protein MSIMFI_00817 [Mycobacterium simulans]
MAPDGMVAQVGTAGPVGMVALGGMAATGAMDAELMRGLRLGIARQAQ